MRIKPFCKAVVLAFLAAALLTPQAGRGAIVENIFLVDTQEQLGKISFPAISGNDATGVGLSIFPPFPPVTEADIRFIQWTLDPVTFAVLDLFLDALHGDDPCPDDVPCSNFRLQLFEHEVSGVGWHCTADGCSIADFFPTPVEFRVPEPGGFAMLAVGLTGMGMVIWRTRRKGRRDRFAPSPLDRPAVPAGGYKLFA